MFKFTHKQADIQWRVCKKKKKNAKRIQKPYERDEILHVSNLMKSNQSFLQKIIEAP